MNEHDVKDITVEELNAKFNNNDKFILVDVRRADEYQHSNIAQSIHIPLDELEERIHEFDADKEYVMQCRSGGRSSSATRFLKANGIENVVNLAGGLIAWSEKIDPSIDVK